MLLSVAVFSVACLFSCGKRDGVVEDGRRIDSVTAVETQYFDNEVYGTTGTYVEEKWNWDGDELFRIDYHGLHTYSENFFLDHRGRIYRTTVPAYSITCEYVYDGRNLESIEICRDGGSETLGLIVFERGDGRVISRIECKQFAEVDTTGIVSDIMNSPLRAIVGHDAAQRLSEVCRDVQAVGRKGAVETTYELTWVDDNVTHIVCRGDKGVREISLTYDDKSNPYSQLFGYRELTDPIYGFEMLSKNNVLTIRMPYGKIENQLFTYEYRYEKKYPVSRTLTYSYPTIGPNFDSVVCKHEKKEYYTYY